MEERPPARTLLLGVGSSIRRDDGIGPVVVRALHERLVRDGRARGVECEEAAFGGMRLIDLLAGYDRAILVDALRDGTLPHGALVRVDPAEGTTANMAGSHGFGLLDALRMAAACGVGLPANVSLYGVVARDLDRFGEGLSDELAARVAPIVEEILDCEFRCR